MLSVECRHCKQEHSIEVSEEAVKQWRNGAKVQDAFPDIFDEDRELFFLSGICGKCWDILFPELD